MSNRCSRCSALTRKEDSIVVCLDSGSSSEKLCKKCYKDFLKKREASED